MTLQDVHNLIFFSSSHQKKRGKPNNILEKTPLFHFKVEFCYIIPFHYVFEIRQVLCFYFRRSYFTFAQSSNIIEVAFEILHLRFASSRDLPFLLQMMEGTFFCLVVL